MRRPLGRFSLNPASAASPRITGGPLADTEIEHLERRRRRADRAGRCRAVRSLREIAVVVRAKYMARAVQRSCPRRNHREGSRNDDPDVGLSSVSVRPEHDRVKVHPSAAGSNSSTRTGRQSVSILVAPPL